MAKKGQFNYLLGVLFLVLIALIIWFIIRQVGG